jgi:glucose/arabinose dehydrogenase
MISRIFRKALGAALLICSMVELGFAALPTGFHQKIIFDKADMVSSAMLPDGRILAVEKFGLISVINQKTGVKSVAIDLSGKTWSNYEAGMMCVLADPNFLINKYLYIQYCKKGAVNGEDHDWVDRFTMNGDIIDPSSAVKILDAGFRGPNYHHGGGMAISPKDGMLYIAVGSRRSSANANQPDMAGKTDNVFGKICRVKIPSGEIPTDNPFYGANIGDARAVYYYGLRNPFTMDFHPSTGKLWWSDVRDGYDDDEKAEGTIAGTGYGYGGGKEQGLFSAGDVGGCNGGAMIGSLWYTGNNFPVEYKDMYFFGNVRNCGSNLVYTNSAHSKFTKFGPFNENNGIYSPIDIKMDVVGAIYVTTRYQTENVKATGGQIIKVWYGDVEPTIPTTTLLQMDGKGFQTNFIGTATPSGLEVELLNSGIQVVLLKTIAGQTIEAITAKDKGIVRFASRAKGVHILEWKTFSQRGIKKIIL